MHNQLLLPIILERGFTQRGNFMTQEIQASANKYITSQFLFPIIFLYLEICFHFARFGISLDNLGYKILFALFYGSLLSFLTELLPKKAKQIALFLLTGFTTLYFEIQIIFSGVFHSFFSPTGFLGVTGQALDFTDVILIEIGKN